MSTRTMTFASMLEFALRDLRGSGRAAEARAA